jgi:hypothetical protein
MMRWGEPDGINANNWAKPMKRAQPSGYAASHFTLMDLPQRQRDDQHLHGCSPGWSFYGNEGK